MRRPELKALAAILLCLAAALCACSSGGGGSGAEKETGKQDDASVARTEDAGTRDTAQTEDAQTEEAVPMSPEVGELCERLAAVEGEKERLASQLEALGEAPEYNEDTVSLYDQLEAVTQTGVYVSNMLIGQLESELEEALLEDDGTISAGLESAIAEASAKRAEDKTYYDRLAAAKRELTAALATDREGAAETKAAIDASGEEFEKELADVITAFRNWQEAKGGAAYDVSAGFIGPTPAGVGEVSRIFGATDAGRPHRGYDLSCPAGTPILSCANGSVVTSGWNYYYGNYVIVDHGNGYTTFYAHCSALLVSAGETVTQGQTIALVGSTGYCGEAHLHFESAYDGIPVDGDGIGIPIYG